MNCLLRHRRKETVEWSHCEIAKKIYSFNAIKFGQSASTATNITSTSSVVNLLKFMYSYTRIEAIFINPGINASILDFGSIPIETVVWAHFRNYVFSVTLTRRPEPIYITQKTFHDDFQGIKGPCGFPSNRFYQCSNYTGIFITM